MAGPALGPLDLEAKQNHVCTRIPPTIHATAARGDHYGYT